MDKFDGDLPLGGSADYTPSEPEDDMSKEKCVATIVNMLVKQYGLVLPPEEFPILALKVYLAVEEVAKNATREAFQDAVTKHFLAPN